MPKVDPSALAKLFDEWVRGDEVELREIPEIADYEVRRELLRARKNRGLARLEALKAMIGYAAITTAVMLKAAEFWAAARRMGGSWQMTPRWMPT